MTRYLLIPLAGLALVTVLILNGGPLYYYDSASYIIQGEAALRGIGFLPAASATALGIDSEAPGGVPGSISGSRSVIYAILMAGIGALAGFVAALLPQLVAFLVALGCFGARIGLPGFRPLGWAVLAGCAGALGFYAAFLMPDLLAPTAILVVAALLVRPDPVHWPMAILLFVIGCFAAVTHLTHLGIIAVFLPIACLAALFQRAAWQAPLLIAAILATGLVERVGFTLAAEHVEQREVVYHPFLTARLIADGPGARYLDQICAADPAANPACPLEARLDRLEPRPERPSEILFLDAADTGSFRLLPSETQARIGQSQWRFALQVISFDPIGVARAMLANSYRQLVHVSIRQTLPHPEMLSLFDSRADGPPPAFAAPKLVAGASWVPIVERVHWSVYGISLVALLLAWFHPRTPPVARRAALLIGLGMLINAALCGAVSEPAPRYGARVAALLPIMAAWMWMLQRSNSAPLRGRAPTF